MAAVVAALADPGQAVQYKEPRFDYLRVRFLESRGLGRWVTPYATVRVGPGMEARTRVAAADGGALRWNEEFLFAVPRRQDVAPTVSRAMRAASPTSTSEPVHEGKLQCQLYHVANLRPDVLLGTIEVPLQDLRGFESASPKWYPLQRNKLKEVTVRVRDRIADEFCHFTGKETYQPGDITRAALGHLKSKITRVASREKGEKEGTAPLPISPDTNGADYKEKDDAEEVEIPEVGEGAEIRLALGYEYGYEFEGEDPGVVGSLRVKVVKAEGLVARKKSESPYAYVVLKYNRSWYRLRTSSPGANPEWNETVQFDVTDPSSALLLGVFDDRQKRVIKDKDHLLGRVCIRASTLDANRAVTAAVQLSCVTKDKAHTFGVLHLELCFSFDNPQKVLRRIVEPPLPIRNYTHPLAPLSVEGNGVLAPLARFRCAAVVTHLASQNPPIRREVCEKMLGLNPRMGPFLTSFSVRGARVNVDRVKDALLFLSAVPHFISGVSSWESPPKSSMTLLVLLIFIHRNPFIVPAIALCAVASLAVSFARRMSGGLQIVRGADLRLSGTAAAAAQGEDDAEDEPEQVDASDAEEGIVASALPTRKMEEALQFAEMCEAKLGDIAATVERFQALFRCEDPRVSGMALAFFSVFFLVSLVIPFKWLLSVAVLVIFRPPKLRSPTPPPPVCAFFRLPSRADRIVA